MDLPDFYKKYVIDRPWFLLTGVLLLAIIAGVFSTGFKLDASGESLILENDKSLSYYRKIREIYGSDDFLVITYTPFGDLLTDESLESLKRLSKNITDLDSVESVISILDVPIVYTTGVKLSEVESHIKTIESGEVSKTDALNEYLSNPFYKDLLISDDGKTTALQVNFKPDIIHTELIKKRNKLHELIDSGKATAQDKKELKEINRTIKDHNSQVLLQQERDVAQIRTMMEQENRLAKLYLGGIPMITTDMIRYIRHDLIVFGGGVIAFLVIILFLFFRDIHWILLPLISCTLTGILALGYLGMMDWRVTVISSNFLSILLIITLSINIHLIVRFRDLQQEFPWKSHHELVFDTIQSMFKPCSFTIITTIVAFASLIISNIRPVMDFGWIMIIGLMIALCISFSFFPATLGMFSNIKTPKKGDFTRVFMDNIAHLVIKTPGTITVVLISLMILSLHGILQLEVENRFIDNFNPSTEIYQGMKIIDQQLGGTTPLEIIIDPDQDFLEIQEDLKNEASEFDILFSGSEDVTTETSYWLVPEMIKKIQAVHEHVESYPTTGKVLSLATGIKVIEHLNQAPLDTIELALIRKRVPEDLSEIMIDPYLSGDSNEVRFNIRVKESDINLNRKNLIDGIKDFLTNQLKFTEDQVHITGMLVLYNNMLQSLYQSQILTIGAVLIAIFLTFILLFRNLLLSALAIIPNIFSTLLILGIMGWMDITLDMMTITIAAITIGISVDDTIHYIHRFQHERKTNPDILATIRKCHTGIGKAMYHTSMAIIFGFAILAMSNFIPTVHFGLLTGFAMLVALIGDLILLPAMLLLVNPHIGPES